MMKQYLLPCLIIAFCACSGHKKLVTGRYAIQDICQAFPLRHSRTLDDIKTECRFIADKSPKKNIKSNPFNSFCATVDEYNYHRIPYYELDLQAFDTNPREENILHSLHSPADVMNIVAERNGKVRARIVARKGENGKWFRSKISFKFDSTMNWLRDSLYQSNTREYKIFSVREEEFVTYRKDGQNLYFKTTGEAIPADALCKHLAEVYNHGFVPYQYRQRPANTGITAGE